MNRFAFFDLNRIMQRLLLPPRLVYGVFVPNLSFTVMTVRLNKRRVGQMGFFYVKNSDILVEGVRSLCIILRSVFFEVYNRPLLVLLCLYLFEDIVSSTSKLNSI